MRGRFKVLSNIILDQIEEDVASAIANVIWAHRVVPHHATTTVD
jgi:hypothetical protein